MRTKTELQDMSAHILRDLRKSAHLSRGAMAERLGVDRRTYSRYESGESAPTLSGFVAMLDRIDAPVLHIIKSYLYPEDSPAGPAISDYRRELTEFIESASCLEIEQLYYFLFGAHGSSLASQLQLVSAYNHLPLDSRLMAAKQIYNIYDIENVRGEIINTDIAMPDMELLHNALVKATLAVYEGRHTYTSGIKE